MRDKEYLQLPQKKEGQDRNIVRSLSFLMLSAVGYTS